MGKNNNFNDLINRPLIVGLFFSIYVILIRVYLFKKYIVIFHPDDIVLIQSFIEWFGVAYGLFIALVLVNVWTQFNTVETDFDKEADSIYMLFQSVQQVKNTKNTKQLTNNILTDISNYIAHVINNFQVEHKRPALREEGDLMLERIRTEIGKIAHTSEREAVTSGLIKEINNAIDLRGDRISHSIQRMPKPVWTISLVSSILWLFPFFGLDFKSDFLAIILVGGVTTVVTAILIIIKDLDDPFDASWKIENKEWEFLQVKTDNKPIIFFVFNINNNHYNKIKSWIYQLFSKKLCVLYLLFQNNDDPSFFEKVDRWANLKIYYRNEFEEFYGEISSLPAIFVKPTNQSKLVSIMDAVKIGKITRLANLQTPIRNKIKKLIV